MKQSNACNWPLGQYKALYSRQFRPENEPTYTENGGLPLHAAHPLRATH